MSSHELIVTCVKKFNESYEPKPKQIECFNHILAGRDLIANLPVGYGKSLLYQVLPGLLAEGKGLVNPVVLVISPLNIIQTEQIETLRQNGVSACRLSYYDNEEGDPELHETDIVGKVTDGEFSIIFAHPEALLNTSSGKALLREKRFTEKVAAVAIDECHIVEEWGEEFRTAFQKLKTLPAIFPNIPFMGLSGTLTTKQIQKLPAIIGLNNPAIVQESPDRSNIFLDKKTKVKSQDVNEVYEDIFKHECEQLHKNPQGYPVSLLFMPLYYISQAAAYLKYLFGECDITTSCYAVLYSKQDREVFKITLAELQKDNPRIRLVLTSSVAGMGFDPPSVVRIIDARPPRNLSQYLQEIGRAGRRGQSSTAILHYNKRDLAKNLPGIQEDIIEYCTTDNKCLREMLMKTFGFSKSSGIPSEKCCSFCLNKELNNLDMTGAFGD